MPDTHHRTQPTERHTMSEPTKERGIIMSAESVRAIFDDRKSQTRRVVKPQPDTTSIDGGPLVTQRPYDGMRWDASHLAPDRREDGWYFTIPGYSQGPFRCPYGVPGDRLYVREAIDAREVLARYAADGAVLAGGHRKFSPRVHPAFLMPKWAARLWLEVTDVRPERVQSITEADAIAEGCTESESVDHSTEGRRLGEFTMGAMHEWHSAVGNFQARWDALNARRGFPFDANPYVWRISFRRIEP